MRPLHEGGGRAGIVLSGSPVFNGAAGSGPSEIRRWLLESDLVEAIVALPTHMFFNTGIATCVWILDNTKRDERRGTVQLIDATSNWTKMGKNLGAKSRVIDADARDRILELYDAFDEADPDPDYSKVFHHRLRLLDDHRRAATARRGRRAGGGELSRINEDRQLDVIVKI
jgi:type I restriction enzyme M protein